MTGRDLYMTALYGPAGRQADALGDLTPTEEAAVRKAADAQFRAEVPGAAAALLAAAKKAADAAAAKKRAAAAALAAKKAAAGNAIAAAATPVGGPSLLSKIADNKLLVAGALGATMLGIALFARGSSEPAPRRRAKNPAGTGAKFYREFHWGRKPTSAKRVNVPAPKTLVELGRVESITYSSLKGTEPITDYVHEFERPRPKLACDPKTKRLHFLGGGYTVEDRGIVG